MKKTYVLDTNVLMQAPYALESFDDNEVVLPLVVLEELDSHKGDEGERGANVRRTIREIDALTLKGDPEKGIKMENGGTFRIEKNCVNVPLPVDLAEHKSDNRILKVCVGLAGEGKRPVILVTKDLVMRIKAHTLGIKVEDFTTDQVVFDDEQYTGRTEVYVPAKSYKEFRKKGIKAEEAYTCNENGNRQTVEFFENEFVIIHNDENPKNTQMGRISGNVIKKLTSEKERPYGVKPSNSGQYFLQEALTLPAKYAPLVIVKGVAGTAKTFYSLAVGLEKMIGHPTGEYRKILVCRPNAQFDDDIGFLPGDEQEKISPLLRPVMDNLEQLIDSDENERYKDETELKDKIEEIFDRGIIEAEALNFIRGRSIQKTYLIIDEAQNMTPSQVKGIITRAGKDTKIILLGDPNQIDKPYLDERTNGLSYAAEHMKGSPLCFQVTMDKSECERSELAMDATSRL